MLFVCVPSPDVAVPSIVPALALPGRSAPVEVGEANQDAPAGAAEDSGAADAIPKPSTTEAVHEPVGGHPLGLGS